MIMAKKLGRFKQFRSLCRWQEYLNMITVNTWSLSKILQDMKIFMLEILSTFPVKGDWQDKLRKLQT